MVIIPTFDAFINIPFSFTTQLPRNLLHEMLRLYTKTLQTCNSDTLEEVMHVTQFRYG